MIPKHLAASQLWLHARIPRLHPNLSESLAGTQLSIFFLSHPGDSNVQSDLLTMPLILRTTDLDNKRLPDVCVDKCTFPLPHAGEAPHTSSPGHPVLSLLTHPLQQIL